MKIGSENGLSVRGASPAVTVRPAEPADIVAHWNHMKRHHSENGRSGDVVFAPVEGPFDLPIEVFEKTARERQAKSLIECGWERVWLIVEAGEVYGDLHLVHRPPISAGLHRATLMMGIERSHRGRGFGRELVAQAIEWAKSHPELHWLDLFVFEKNEPARALYKRMGFEENGATVDRFRVFGQSITDISMVLKLRH